MKNLLSLIALLTLGSAASTQAGILKVLPEDIALTGPHARQQLLVVEEANGRVIADRTAQARIVSAQPAVARVVDGTVRVVGDGTAVLTATWEGRSASAKVTVTGVNQSFAWSFRNHVIPVLTRLGCNSGACHGALAGKGGLKLSLR